MKRRPPVWSVRLTRFGLCSLSGVACLLVCFCWIDSKLHARLIADKEWRWEPSQNPPTFFHGHYCTYANYRHLIVQSRDGILIITHMRSIYLEDSGIVREYMQGTIQRFQQDERDLQYWTFANKATFKIPGLQLITGNHSYRSWSLQPFDRYGRAQEVTVSFWLLLIAAGSPAALIIVLRVRGHSIRETRGFALASTVSAKSHQPNYNADYKC